MIYVVRWMDDDDDYFAYDDERSKAVELAKYWESTFTKDGHVEVLEIDLTLKLVTPIYP